LAISVGCGSFKFVNFEGDPDDADRNHSQTPAAREQAGRAPNPTARMIDSQSVKTTQSGGPRSFDAGVRAT